jgi:hypothetical protein
LIGNLENAWYRVEGNLNKVSLSIRFNKLKKLGTKAFDSNGEISIDFEKHKYQITFRPDEIVERLYHQLPTEKEVDEIAEKFVSSIITQIEAQIKQYTKKG